MSNLKQLMAGRKAAARIQAPFASYSSGSLACSLCGLKLKESLWGAHIISKVRLLSLYPSALCALTLFLSQNHRVAIQKDEREQQLAAERKRKRDDDQDGDSPEGATSKRAKEDDGPAPGALPAGFFSDPSQAPPPPSSSAAPPAPDADATASATTPAPADDPEWDEFEAYLASAPDPSAVPAKTTASATITAAPVDFEFGAPKEDEEGEGEEEEEEPLETEEERVEREMMEEREDMMQRLEEEEREQREADEKVTVRTLSSSTPLRSSLSILIFPSSRRFSSGDSKRYGQRGSRRQRSECNRESAYASLLHFRPKKRTKSAGFP